MVHTEEADKGGSIDSRCFARSGSSRCQNGTKLETNGAHMKKGKLRESNKCEKIRKTNQRIVGLCFVCN